MYNYKFICVYICLTFLLPIEMTASQWEQDSISSLVYPPGLSLANDYRFL